MPLLLAVRSASQTAARTCDVRGVGEFSGVQGGRFSPNKIPLDKMLPLKKCVAFFLLNKNNMLILDDFLGQQTCFESQKQGTNS